MNLPVEFMGFHVFEIMGIYLCWVVVLVILAQGEVNDALMPLALIPTGGTIWLWDKIASYVGIGIDWLSGIPGHDIFSYACIGILMIGLIGYLFEKVSFSGPNSYSSSPSHSSVAAPPQATQPLVYTRETMPQIHVCENPVFDLAEFQPPPRVQQPAFQEVHISYPDSPASNDADEIPFNTNPNNGRL